MSGSSRIIKRFAVLATGGMLLQVSGCVAALAPVAVSLVESVVLDAMMTLLSTGAAAG